MTYERIIYIIAIISLIAVFVPIFLIFIETIIRRRAQKLQGLSDRLQTVEIKKMKDTIAGTLREVEAVITRQLEEEDNNTVDYSSQLESLSREMSTYYSRKITGNVTLDSILAYYVKICDDSGIRLEISMEDTAALDLSEDDIICLFCNLFDNAVEAAEQSESRWIRIRSFLKNDQWFCLMENARVAGVDIFFDNERLKTTKSDKGNHGFGIRIVSKIVKKNGGVVTWEASGECFTVCVSFDGKESENNY